MQSENDHLVVHILAQQKHLRHKSPIPHRATFQSLFLVKAHVGIAISVFNADYHVADDRNAGSVAQELLAGGLCVILFRLYELMVKVKIVLLPSLQLPNCKQGIDQQTVLLAV